MREPSDCFAYESRYAALNITYLSVRQKWVYNPTLLLYRTHFCLSLHLSIVFHPNTTHFLQKSRKNRLCKTEAVSLLALVSVIQLRYNFAFNGSRNQLLFGTKAAFSNHLGHMVLDRTFLNIQLLCNSRIGVAVNI